MKKLRYNKKPTSRIPAVADASRRHLTARSGLEVMLYELLQHALVQKERRNDLPELTPQRARELYEAYRRGEMADVQLMWDQLEERDETLFTVLHSRLGALAEMPWAVNIDADLAEDMQPLAEQQQELANKLLAAVENLPEALTHLGMADFRGVAALEVVGDLRGTIDDLRFANNGEPALAGESEAQATATARALGAATPASDSACLGEAEGRRREPNSINRTSYIVNRKFTMRWEVIEPWNLCRPVRRGPWYYNAEATSTPTRPEELDPAAVIIREAQPIDLPAMFLICAKYLSVHAWDAFLEVFGIPNIFLEMPPATPEGKAMEFDAIVQRLIGEGRGTVPSGAKFHTVETSKDNTQSFEARAKWCNEAIIQLATGGLLTVTTQSGSGTLAGNAHSDSFSRLCAASARSISAAINRQFLRPALQEAFPHTPILVQFELAPEPVDDRLQLAQLLGAVNSAGFRPSAETVSELMNFEVQPVQEAAPGQPPVVNGRGLPAAAGNENISGSGVARPSETPGLGAVVANANNDLTRDDIAEAEPPLNDGELAALRALGGELNPAQIAADADYMTREMLAGLREPLTNRGEGGHECKATKRACPLAAVENLAESCKQGYIQPPRHKSQKARKEYQERVTQAAREGKLTVTCKGTGKTLKFTEQTCNHLANQTAEEADKRFNNIGNLLATAENPDIIMEHKQGRKSHERVYQRAMRSSTGKGKDRGPMQYFRVVEDVANAPGEVLTAYVVDSAKKYNDKIKPQEVIYRK